jgi:mevalonate kinase
MPSIIKPVIKDDTRGQTSVNLEHLIKSDRSTEASTENHDLHFKTNRKIEEEIENVKRIAHEAKQTVIESVKNIQTSHEEEMNRKININQLSDQVYRLLDRKITIEKERRGYI